MTKGLCRWIVPLFLILAAPAAGQVARKGEAKRELVVGRWYPSVVTGINLTQSSYSDNWSGGDRGSLVWTFLTEAGLENQVSRKMNWNSALKLAFGQTHQQRTTAQGDRAWDRPSKSTDLIDLESVARFTLGRFVDPFASVRFESQFQDLSDPEGRSLRLNPIKLKESAGIARKLIDTEDRSLLSRFGFTFRQSARKLFRDAAPSEATTTETTNDGGLEWVTDFKAKVLSERVAWTSKLTAFQPLFFSGKDDLEKVRPVVADHAMTGDLDWENIFSTQITKLISVGLYSRLVYDKYDNSVKPLLNDSGELTNPGQVARAIRKAGQFKQTLSIGITYRLL